MRNSTIFNTGGLLARLALAALCYLPPAITRYAHAEPEPSATSQPSPTPLGTLAMAIQVHDVGTGGPALLKVLADLGVAVNSGKSVGTAIQEILTSGGIPTANQEGLRQTLLANWRSAYEFGLFTPENLSLMRAGTLPVVTIGGYRGQATVTLSVPAENGTPSGFFRLVPMALQQMLLHSTTAGTVFAVPPGMMAQSSTASIYRPARPPVMAPRFSGVPAPSATPSTVVDFVDIARGDGISLEKYGYGTEKVFINGASEKEGVHYAMVDPSKMKKEWQTVSLSSVGYPISTIKLIPNTTSYTAAWRFTPIPGTSERGVFLTKYKGAAVYFVKATDLDGDHYRMCVVADRRPEVNRASPRAR